MATDDKRDRDGDLDFMLRPAAAAYLSKRLGRPVSVSAMKVWAHEGRGPRFVVIMRRASYTKDDLDAWIASPDAQRRPGGYRPRRTDD